MCCEIVYYKTLRKYHDCSKEYEYLSIFIISHNLQITNDIIILSIFAFRNEDICFFLNLTTSIYQLKGNYKEKKGHI